MISRLENYFRLKTYSNIKSSNWNQIVSYGIKVESQFIWHFNRKIEITQLGFKTLESVSIAFANCSSMKYKQLHYFILKSARCKFWPSYVFSIVINLSFIETYNTFLIYSYIDIQFLLSWKSRKALTLNIVYIQFSRYLNNPQKSTIGGQGKANWEAPTRR